MKEIKEKIKILKSEYSREERIVQCLVKIIKTDEEFILMFNAEEFGPAFGIVGEMNDEHIEELCSIIKDKEINFHSTVEEGVLIDEDVKKTLIDEDVENVLHSKKLDKIIEYDEKLSRYPIDRVVKSMIKQQIKEEK